MTFRKLIVYIVLLTGFYACKKESNGPVASISGSWYQQRKRVDNLVNREIFNFKPDKSIEVTEMVVDTVANEIKGYVSKATGSYRFKRDSVILENVEKYSVKSYTYKKLDELEYVVTHKRMSYKVVYSASKDTLTYNLSAMI